MTAVLAPAALPGRPARHVDALFYLALAAAALGLKHFYAQASAEELRFILRPTAGLVALLCGGRWSFEAGVGFVSVAHATAIVPACAGINFLIVAMGALVAGLLSRITGILAKVLYCCASATVAFVATIVANGTRIAVDVALRNLAMDPALHGHVHRMTGVFVYLGCACLLHTLARRVTGQQR